MPGNEIVFLSALKLTSKVKDKTAQQIDFLRNKLISYQSRNLCCQNAGTKG